MARCGNETAGLAVEVAPDLFTSRLSRLAAETLLFEAELNEREDDATWCDAFTPHQSIRCASASVTAATFRDLFPVDELNVLSAGYKEEEDKGAFELRLRACSL
jgi:hypothetical protein